MFLRRLKITVFRKDELSEWLKSVILSHECEMEAIEEVYREVKYGSFSDEEKMFIACVMGMFEAGEVDELMSELDEVA